MAGKSPTLPSLGNLRPFVVMRQEVPNLGNELIRSTVRNYLAPDLE